MHATFFTLTRRLEPKLKKGDLEAVEQAIEKKMKEIPKSPFHIVLKLKIDNKPPEAARHFDRLFKAAGKKFEVAAAWTEMNGFDINPDRWYCDLFAKSSDDYDPNADQSIPWETLAAPQYKIRGFEKLQKVYDSEAFTDAEDDEASSICSLLVAVKFQRFITTASRQMKELHFPLYVTAHGFEFILKLRSTK